jgi:hypothetical protein
MNNNSMLQLSLYKSNSTWAFDDEKRSIVSEPFVLGMSEIITHYVPDSDRCEVLFSIEKFPSCRTLQLLNEDCNGGWYRDQDSNLQGWLCPVTRVYLNGIPDNIFYSINYSK